MCCKGNLGDFLVFLYYYFFLLVLEFLEGTCVRYVIINKRFFIFLNGFEILLLLNYCYSFSKRFFYFLMVYCLKISFFSIVI